jgi:antitoxin component of MazEF toxin-antitoxin module
VIKKLSKHGNSLALVIDKPILKLLKFDESTQLEIAIKDGSLIIKPVFSKQKEFSAVQKEKLINEAIEKVMDQYEEALKKLAK